MNAADLRQLLPATAHEALATFAPSLLDRIRALLAAGATPSEAVAQLQAELGLSVQVARYCLQAARFLIELG